MTKRLQKNIALVCAVCLLTLLMSGYAAMDNDLPAEDEGVLYEKVAISVDGELLYSGYVIDGRTYIPFRSFCGALNLGAVVFWDPESATANGLAENFMVTAGEGDQYITVNERCFYAEGGVVNYRGILLVPLRVLCDAFSVEIQWDEDTGDVNLLTDDLEICLSGAAFYDEDNLYWLSRIISAEAKDQSMTGKICVGNVVMNRAESDHLPDTIREVIFDSTYGIQFSPVSNGSIYNEPDEESIVAAKLCLEGVELAGDSLYFVNPSIGSTKWFNVNRTFVTSVGDHDFYA